MNIRNCHCSRTHGALAILCGMLLFVYMPRAYGEQEALYGNIAGTAYRIEQGATVPLAGAKIYAIPGTLESTTSGAPDSVETARGWFRIPELAQIEASTETGADGKFLISGVTTGIPATPYTIIAAANNFRPVIFHQIPVYPGVSLHVNVEVVFDATAIVSPFYLPDDPAIPLIYGQRISAETIPPQPTAQTRMGTLGLTYTVFATREGLVGYTTANGHVIASRDHFVALPTRDYLCPNDGNRDFQVRITYNGKTATAPVWDVGPWNIHDNYVASEAQRKIYAYLNYGGQSGGLGQGVPEAQAAYLNDFNQGYDEFSRQVANPAGIDIADGTFWDDLGMSGNAWVQVEYLWTTNCISGSVSGHWTLANSPYKLCDHVTVPQGSSLLIDPGVVIEYNGKSLTVLGTLTWGTP